MKECVNNSDTSDEKSFDSEAKILSQLGHKNIVSFINHFRDSLYGNMCIVMEYCDVIKSQLKI